MHVFLILVFSVHGGSVNITTAMPDLETCEAVKAIHEQELPHPYDWGLSEVKKPVIAKCYTIGK